MKTVQINTPMGVKTIRANQTDQHSERYIKVIDCLGQHRWMAIQSLHQQGSTLIGRILGTYQEIVLKPTTFLEKE